MNSGMRRDPIARQSDWVCQAAQLKGVIGCLDPASNTTGFRHP